MSKGKISSAANTLMLPEDTGRQEPGVICAANESRFLQSNFSEPLTSYSVGWRDPNDLQQVLDSITGQPITVGRRFEFKKADNAEAFLMETDDARAIGSAFKKVEYTGETVNAKLANRGLTTRIDKDEIEPGDTMWQERITGMLTERLIRNKIIRALAALKASAHSTAAIWTYNAESNPHPNPDGDMRTALMTATSKSGLRPNRILIGESAWDLRTNAYNLQETAGAFASMNMTPDQVAARLFVDKVIPIRSRYTSGASRLAMLGNSVISYMAFDGASKDEPSNIKRFIGSGGRKVYLKEDDKWWDITVEDYDLILITSTLGIEALDAS